MKKIIFALALTIFAAQLFAQRGHRGPSIETLKKELDLTETQVQELKVLKEEMKLEMQSFRDAEQRPSREEMRSIKEQQKEKMIAILTPDQIQKMESMRAAHHEKRTAHKEANKEKLQAAKKEMKAYHKNEVMPVLLAQRKKLEKEISRKDKKEIAKLRALQIDFKEKVIAEHEARKEKAKLSGDEKKGRKGKGHRIHRGKRHGSKAFHFTQKFTETYPKEAAKLEVLSEKYDAKIESLMAEIADEKAEWKQKKDEVKEEFKGRHPKKHKGKDCKKECDNKKANAGKSERKAKFESAKKVQFLLMDPKGSAQNTDTTTPLNIGKLHQANVYPNPATNDQTLEFEVTQSGNVLVEIIDKKGKVIQQVFNGTMTEGSQTINVDISNLKGYIFYYRITDKAGVSSTKFMTKR